MTISEQPRRGLDAVAFTSNRAGRPRDGRSAEGSLVPRIWRSRVTVLLALSVVSAAMTFRVVDVALLAGAVISVIIAPAVRLTRALLP